jgi:hypothetical protein
METTPTNSNLLRLLLPMESPLLNPRATDDDAPGDTTLNRETLNKAKDAVSTLSLRLLETTELHTSLLGSLVQLQPPSALSLNGFPSTPNSLSLFNAVPRETLDGREETLRRLQSMVAIHQLQYFSSSTVPNAFSLFHQRLDHYSTRLIRIQHRLIAVTAVFREAKVRTRRLLASRVSFFVCAKESKTQNPPSVVLIPQPLRPPTVDHLLQGMPELATAVLSLSKFLQQSLQLHQDQLHSAKHFITKLHLDGRRLLPSRENEKQLESRIGEQIKSFETALEISEALDSYYDSGNSVLPRLDSILGADGAAFPSTLSAQDASHPKTDRKRRGRQATTINPGPTLRFLQLGSADTLQPNAAATAESPGPEGCPPREYRWSAILPLECANKCALPLCIRTTETKPTKELNLLQMQTTLLCDLAEEQATASLSLDRIHSLMEDF